jgi:hypothetical protein
VAAVAAVASVPAAAADPLTVIGVVARIGSPSGSHLRW